MRPSLFTHFTKLATSCILVLGTATTFVAVSAEPAFADGNGSSGRGATRVLTKDSTKELSVITSFEVSNSPESDVAEYRNHHEMLVAALEERSLVLREYTRLRDLTPEQIAAEFPEGGHDAAVSEALQKFALVREMLGVAQEASDEALLRLTGGQTLSDGALQELHSTLGM